MAASDWYSTAFAPRANMPDDLPIVLHWTEPVNYQKTYQSSEHSSQRVVVCLAEGRFVNKRRDERQAAEGMRQAAKHLRDYVAAGPYLAPATGEEFDDLLKRLDKAEDEQKG
jgi:hypothetical protein